MSAILLDTALNLIWVGVAVSALGWLAISEFRRHRHSSRRTRALRLLAILIVLAALFPVVSFSDDLFSFSLLASACGSGVVNSKSSLQLASLLNMLDHLVIAGFSMPALTLSCFAFVRLITHQLFGLPVLSRPGRAPPLT